MTVSIIETPVSFRAKPMRLGSCLRRGNARGCARLKKARMLDWNGRDFALGDHDIAADLCHFEKFRGKRKWETDASMRSGITRNDPRMSAVPDLVRRCIHGIGALLYRLEWWNRFFSRMLNMPVLVS